ncbi:hypothetical protein K6121_08890 [Neisseria subflava]|uniref:hypothetical protein n=1 Tax=Neisseria subflava TaxID=28449 RepID=UPI001C992F47|nr:hypothetical protein [Neisseria subflava]MBY6286469.1 hypothetical protein [Neisseria subflava]
MARKKQKWQVGDYFGIPVEDDFLLAVGQILGKYDWIGVACLITKMKISSKNLPLYEDIKIDKNDIIAAIFITEESLDKGFWPIIQQGIVNKNILKQYFPNIDLIEQGNIIGINTEDSAIIDDFIKAYFSLAPWDDWHDPEYLDKLLISPDKKPENLIYKNKCSIPTQSLS